MSEDVVFGVKQDENEEIHGHDIEKTVEEHQE